MSWDKEGICVHTEELFSWLQRRQTEIIWDWSPAPNPHPLHSPTGQPVHVLKESKMCEDHDETWTWGPARPEPWRRECTNWLETKEQQVPSALVAKPGFTNEGPSGCVEAHADSWILTPGACPLHTCHQQEGPWICWRQSPASRVKL